MEKFIPAYIELSKIIKENPNRAETYFNRGNLISNTTRSL